MKKTSETIVFFGSGPVAAASLELLSKSFEIEAVVTKPRPAHHHGDVPVLNTARELRLPIIEAANKKELSDKIANVSLNSQVGILIDSGIIVAQDVIDAFPLGIVNSHFSLLPEWRGADPITFAILSGQMTTGVSLMLLVEKMDEGPLLTQHVYNIKPNETTPSLTQELIHLSATALCDTIPAYISGKIKPEPQTVIASKIPRTVQISYSRKLTKEDGLINWQKPAEALEREIRAFQSWPKSYTSLAGKEVVITKAHVTPDNYHPGEIVATNKLLVVGTAQKSLAIDSLIPAGKKEMTAAAFLAGYGQKLR